MWSATYANEKSLRANAAQRTPAATIVEPSDAMSAFCAETASRRFRCHAANEPATSAYTTSPKLRRRAALPRGAIYVCFDFAGAYFDGHFVERLPFSATNVPSRSLPVTTTS